MWAQVKYSVASQSLGPQNMTALISLTRKAFETVTAERWSAICAYVDKIVEDYKRKELLVDDALAQIEFTVNNGSSDEEGDKDEYEDDDSDRSAESWNEFYLGVAPL